MAKQGSPKDLSSGPEEQPVEREEPDTVDAPAPSEGESPVPASPVDGPADVGLVDRARRLGLFRSKGPVSVRGPSAAPPPRNPRGHSGRRGRPRKVVGPAVASVPVVSEAVGLAEAPRVSVASVGSGTVLSSSSSSRRRG